VEQERARALGRRNVGGRRDVRRGQRRRGGPYRGRRLGLARHRNGRDRLWDLSAHYYQDPLKWKRLFRENRDHVADPDVIFPGQRIRVPIRAR
jgi:hypothetical protein